MLLVTIDTLRADHVGCYGAARARTPVLDALAAGGVRFATALSPAPLTLPAHASLMTALDPPAHGVRHNGSFTLAGSIPTLAERMRARGFATAAFVGALVLDRRFGLERGFDRYDDDMGARRSGLVGYAERPANLVVDAALAWLAAAPPSWFAWIHFYDPHAGYDPPPGFAVAFASAPYDGEVAFVDSELGRLLAGVRERYGEEGTLVVVTADHGESLGEHGEPTHSYTLYDATQRVPLILSGPGLPKGRVVEGVARLVDVAPTLLARAGAEPLPDTAGADLGPLLADREREPRLAYMETLAPQLDFGWSALYGLRTSDWKLIRAPSPELYALAQDPGETRNLIGEHTEVVERLEPLLEAKLDAAPRAPASRIELAAEERERLQSLGYLAGTTTGAAELGRVGGLDPKEQMGVLATLNRGLEILTAGRPGEALALLEPLGDQGPQLAVLRAAAALRAGNPVIAERDARAALRDDPARGDALLLLAQALEQARRFPEARESYARAEQNDPGVAEPVVGLGRIAEAEGDRAGAARLYARARQARAGGPEAVWRLAALAREDGRPEEAQALLAGIDAEALLQPEAALRMAQAEIAAGEPAAAFRRLEAARAANPTSVVLASRHGTLLEEAGRLEEALTAREATLALQPGTPALENDLAWTLARLGRDLDRALALVLAAQRAAGSDPNVLDTLATVRHARGEPALALAAAEQALATASPAQRPHLLYLEAAALAKLGRKGEARSALQGALLRDDAPTADFWRAAARALAQELRLPPAAPLGPG